MRPAAVTDELQAQPWPRCQLHMGRSQLQSQMQSEAARCWLDDARQARNSGSVNAVLNAFLSGEDKAGLLKYSLLSKMPDYLYISLQRLRQMPTINASKGDHQWKEQCYITERQY